MGSARGGRRPGRSSRDANHAHAEGEAQAAPPTEPVSARMVLEMVAANPMLQGTHVVNRALVQQGLERIEQPTVRKYASTALVEMLQGTGPSFAVLQGAPSVNA